MTRGVFGVSRGLFEAADIQSSGEQAVADF